MPSEAESREPRNTLQQEFLRMSHAQKKQVIRDECAHLAEHYAANPEDILPDITDGDSE